MAGLEHTWHSTTTNPLQCGTDYCTEIGIPLIFAGLILLVLLRLALGRGMFAWADGCC